jgi:methylenetetrahydrofolate--tRNA-(uracil-5-)-methyltransferase
MTREQYEAFVSALVAGDKTVFHEWEATTPYFDGCMPIEVMAARGIDTLRYGPMKPVGLDNPHAATAEFPNGRWAYAVVQLRQDNALGTLWNMVGFQTKLKHAEQVRLFRTIPGLENAQFARLGGLHRNTFLNSPRLLDRQLRLKTAPHIRFAGQITGCEGYVESAAVGLLAGLMTADQLGGSDWSAPPRTTALGALLSHITGDADAETYQPMNVNFGLFPPPVEAVRKKQRKQAYTDRAKVDLSAWLAQHGDRVAGTEGSATWQSQRDVVLG